MLLRFYNVGHGMLKKVFKFSFDVDFCIVFQFLRAMELEQFFPIIDPKAKQTGKPKLFVSLLWKQLNHLG